MPLLIFSYNNKIDLVVTDVILERGYAPLFLYLVKKNHLKIKKILL